MCIFGSGSSAQASAQMAAQNQQAQTAQMQQQADQTAADAKTRADAITTGKQNIDSAFGSFDDNFFNNLSKSYTDYAQPQLDDQYNYAKKNITYALARNGTTNSSMAGDEFGQLAKQYATNQTGISSTGANYANSARAGVAADKSDVTNQLISSGDADAANTAALSAAKVLQVPPSFSPLGSLFTNVSALAAQNKLASDSNATGYGNVGAQLFGGGSSTPSSYGVP